MGPEGAVGHRDSNGLIVNANDLGGATLPADGPSRVDGAAVSCADFKAGDIADLGLVAQLGCFDSALGDIRSGNPLLCQSAP